MFSLLSVFSRERIARKMIAIHRNSPITSSACQKRGRSRYSHCWSKKIEPLAQSTPKVLSAVPIRVPATTTNNAPSSP